MKEPIVRLRELTKILKDNMGVLKYRVDLRCGFSGVGLWQKNWEVIFIGEADKRGNVLYLEDIELDDDELLTIVEDLERML
jgi:hypothetical protein